MPRPHRLIAGAARLWWRVRRPRTFGVRGLVIDPDGRIALVRHTYAAAWYLPGGGVKKGESADAALVRELGEEVALGAVTIERVYGVFHSRNEGKDDHVVVFVTRVADPAMLRANDAWEIAEACWAAPDRLPEDTSPATRRRIAEWLAGTGAYGAW